MSVETVLLILAVAAVVLIGIGIARELWGGDDRDGGCR